MKEYRIITDSAFDMTAEFAEMNDIAVVPLKYLIDGKENPFVLDFDSVKAKDFYDKMRNGLNVTTTQANPDECEVAFRKELDAGNDILCITFSSALSGTCNSFRLAKEALSQDFPDSKIMIIDSLCASSGQGLLVYYAAQFKNQGLTLEETYEEVLKLRPRLQHWFTVEDIDLLKRGGRISGAQAFMAKTLLIKPVLRVSIDGKLMSVNKKIGRRAALNQIVDNFFELVDKELVQTIIVSHADSFEDAKYVAEKIKSKALSNNVQIGNVFYNLIGPVIGAHSGPGTIALFFVGKDKY